MSAKHRPFLGLNGLNDKDADPHYRDWLWAIWMCVFKRIISVALIKSAILQNIEPSYDLLPHQQQQQIAIFLHILIIVQQFTVL